MGATGSFKLDQISENVDLELDNYNIPGTIDPIYLRLIKAKLRLNNYQKLISENLVYKELLHYADSFECSDHINLVTINNQKDFSDFHMEDDFNIDNPSIILAECLEINDLNVFETFIQKFSVEGGIIGINLGNNLIELSDDPSVFSSLSSPNLLYIHLGGNRISSLHFLSKNFNKSSLLVLDLSYTESLAIERDSFITLPQLTKLILDGCNISQTVIRLENSSSYSSIFTGLINLHHLSLKDNDLDSLESFIGITYFSFSDLGFENELLPNHSDIFPPCLRSISLKDNPYNCNDKLKLEVHNILASAIPTLQYIDGNIFNKPDMHISIDLSKILKREVGASANIGGLQGKGLDNMEIEYLAALKNEKDFTVIN
jgi:hypothetical protein